MRAKAKTLIWAHRGSSCDRPENTMAAFERAYELGADGIELDVHLTKDGVPVVIHDETFARTSAGVVTGRVCDYTWAEAKYFNLALQHKDQPYPLPSLEQVLRRFVDTDLIINIELKTDQIDYPQICEKVLELCERCAFPWERLFFSSFYAPTVERLHQLKGELNLGFLYQRFCRRAGQRAKKLGANALHPHYAMLFLPFYLESLKRKFALNPWTVDRPRVMKYLIWRGVHAIITNKPELALKIRDKT